MEWYELILIIAGTSSLTNRLFKLLDIIDQPSRKTAEHKAANAEPKGNRAGKIFPQIHF